MICRLYSSCYRLHKGSIRWSYKHTQNLICGTYVGYSCGTHVGYLCGTKIKLTPFCIILIVVRRIKFIELKHAFIFARSKENIIRSFQSRSYTLTMKTPSKVTEQTSLNWLYTRNKRTSPFFITTIILNKKAS